MLMRDLNAGKGVIGDDGKPVVGRVFSRVYQMPGESKLKSNKSRRHRKADESPACKHDKGSPPRPQSSHDGKSRKMRENSNHRNNNCTSICPACGRRISEEAMKQHSLFCKGATKKVK
ncbi:unnamed protein product [Orchesella dallaii]|uniref:Uncharacterized protein n=1 Tax=Orchesella dallaii TaxID=48710 RepID=A0ABP1S9Z4_9HEXA